MRKAMIDTEIWSIAKKRPDETRFPSRREFARALEMHRRARDFFRNTFPGLRVYMSTHQIAEIYHVLAFRGTKIPRRHAESIVRAIIEDDNVVKVPVMLDHVEEAVRASAETGVHVWDYLCFIPVKDYIDVVFTCDDHFIKIGEKYGVKILNPLGAWIKV